MDTLYEWRSEQRRLPRLLDTRRNFDEGIQLFLRQHSAVHSVQLSQGQGWSLEDVLVRGLTPEQMRRSVRLSGGANSIIWIIWHIARTEDVTMNLFVAGRPQVLSTGDWAVQMCLSQHDIGTGMADDEVEDLSRRVSIDAVRAYRSAVGLRTKEIASHLCWEDLQQGIDAHQIEALWKAGALDERAHGLAYFWAAKKKRFFLTMPATRHPFSHLSQALAIKEKVIS
ncbi:MAG: DinB family protein [Chloroflexi bacterium]|nr:DinB family protein [Chloroflexota bacterium]